MTGILDYLAKTADGIKNTVKSDDLNQSRSRPIRAFYGEYQHLRDYSEEDSIFVSFHGKHNESTKLIDTVSGFKIGGNEAADGFMGVTENVVSVIMNRKPLFGIAVKNLQAPIKENHDFLEIRWTDAESNVKNFLN